MLATCSRAWALNRVRWTGTGGRLGLASLWLWVPVLDVALRAGGLAVWSWPFVSGVRARFSVYLYTFVSNQLAPSAGMHKTERTGELR